MSPQANEEAPAVLEIINRVVLNIRRLALYRNLPFTAQTVASIASENGITFLGQHNETYVLSMPQDEAAQATANESPFAAHEPIIYALEDTKASGESDYDTLVILTETDFTDELRTTVRGWRTSGAATAITTRIGHADTAPSERLSKESRSRGSAIHGGDTGTSLGGNDNGSERGELDKREGSSGSGFSWAEGPLGHVPRSDAGGCGEANGDATPSHEPTATPPAGDAGSPAYDTGALAGGAGLVGGIEIDATASDPGFGFFGAAATDDYGTVRDDTGQGGFGGGDRPLADTGAPDHGGESNPHGLNANLAGELCSDTGTNASDTGGNRPASEVERGLPIQVTAGGGEQGVREDSDESPADDSEWPNLYRSGVESAPEPNPAPAELDASARRELELGLENDHAEPEILLEAIKTQITRSQAELNALLTATEEAEREFNKTLLRTTSVIRWVNEEAASKVGMLEIAEGCFVRHDMITRLDHRADPSAMVLYLTGGERIAVDPARFPDAKSLFAAMDAARKLNALALTTP